MTRETPHAIAAIRNVGSLGRSTAMQGVGPIMLCALGQLGLASTVKPDGLRLSRKKAKVSEEKTSSKEKVVCEQGVHAVN